jgi:putative transcriptional regulator
VQAEKKEKPTARSSTFHFARTSQNKKSLPFPPPPKLNDYFNTHLVRYSNIISILQTELTYSKMNRIKEVLEKKGIKQKWLAEELGKSYNMVNSYAQNRRQPSLETLFEIAKILNVEVKSLIKEN